MVFHFLTLSKKRRLSFVSLYNVKLYKKCLSLKLYFEDPSDYNLPNLCVKKTEILEKDLPIKSSKDFMVLRCFYNRKERIAFRLLRFLHSAGNDLDLLKFGVRLLVAQRLSVYNGKKPKFININTGYVVKVMKCNFTFGDLIFTRARCIYRRKIDLKTKMKKEKRKEKKDKEKKVKKLKKKNK